MTKKIVTFGEIMLRLSTSDHQRLMQSGKFNGDYGGSEANVAISLAQFGDPVEFITRVPDNAMGRAALLHLQQYGLSTRHIAIGGDRLGTYYFEGAAALRSSKVVYDREGSSFATLHRGDIRWEDIFEDAGLFHCSGITCATSAEACTTTLDAMESARRHGLVVTCDINYRKNLWRYPGANAQQTLAKIVGQSEFVFGDQDEWEVASGMKAIPFEAPDADYELDLNAYADYFDHLHRQFPSCRRMLMALRNQMTSSHHTLTGILWAEGRLYTTRIYDITGIVDAMGVGDAFVAAFIHAFYKWKGDEQRCLDFALTASALKNSVPGDQNLITEEEVEEEMRR